VREHARTIYGIVMIVKRFLIDKDRERHITCIRAESMNFWGFESKFYYCFDEVLFVSLATDLHKNFVTMVYGRGLSSQKNFRTYKNVSGTYRYFREHTKNFLDISQFYPKSKNLWNFYENTKNVSTNVVIFPNSHSNALRITWIYLKIYWKST
jgi:hypothetical protein